MDDVNWTPINEAELVKGWYLVAINNPEKFGFTYEAAFCNGRYFYKNTRWEVEFVAKINQPNNR